MKAMIAALLLASLAGAALAQDHNFLSKAEVESLALGKTWHLVRTSDERQVRWDLKPGGSLERYVKHGNSSKNPENWSHVGGTWLVNDKAQICVKWRDLPNAECFAVEKQGEALKMFNANNLKIASHELSVK